MLYYSSVVGIIHMNTMYVIPGLTNLMDHDDTTFATGSACTTDFITPLSTPNLIVHTQQKSQVKTTALVIVLTVITSSYHTGYSLFSDSACVLEESA